MTALAESPSSGRTNRSSSGCRPGAGLALGRRICRRITREYARTFYFASHSLPARTRAHAYAIYGFCRWADNAVDDASDMVDAQARLERVRQALDLAYAHSPAPPALLAFRETVRTCRVPRSLFDDLLSGMEMDLLKTRYHDYEELDLYCYRVAGVVGLMMARVFGFRHPRCLPQAEALGRAMQLTNILRDVGEDLERGRIYLPLDECRRFGVSEAQLVQGVVDGRFRAFMQYQIERARREYREADRGVPDLEGAFSRLTVRVMSRLYGGILLEIERNGYDVFRKRAHVSTPRKLWGLVQCGWETVGERMGREWQGLD